MKTSALFLVASLGAFSLVAQAAPVGMIAQIKGQVSTTYGDKKAPARLLGRLEPGTTVSVGAGSSAIVVLFANGSRYQIGPGNKTVNATDVAGATPMAGLAGPSANAVKLLGNARVGAIMARPAATYERLQSDSPAYLVNPKPRFDWKPEAGAARYVFTLFDRSDNVLWAESTDQTGLDYPRSLAQLAEKRPYLWKLTAFSTSGKPVKSRFGFLTVLSEEDAKALETRIAEINAPASPAVGETNLPVLADSEKASLLLQVDTYLEFGVVNSALEVLDRQNLKNEDGVAQAKADVLDSLSPYARVLTGRGIEAPKADALP
jgi:hypothetical protein